VVPPKEAGPALAAPGLGGPISMLKQPISGPRSSRRRRNRPYSHIHLEVDLGPLPASTPLSPTLDQSGKSIAGASDPGLVDLARLISGTLHAMSARRFRRIDHWEVAPGRWRLPPGGTDHEDAREPVGPLLKALGDGSLGSLAKVRSFSAQMSDLSGNRVEVVVRRVGAVHPHALSLDLWGHWTSAAVDDLTGSLAARLPVLHSTMTKFQYA
jgi:hypothetical protein